MYSHFTDADFFFLCFTLMQSFFINTEKKIDSTLKFELNSLSLTRHSVSGSSQKKKERQEE